MSTELVGILLIGLCALVSLIQGFNCARRALKQNDNALTVFAVVFLVCGTVLLMCLNNIVE